MIIIDHWSKILSNICQIDQICQLGQSDYYFVRINYEILANCQIFFYQCKHFNNNLKIAALILHDTLVQSLINSLLTRKSGYS